MTMMTDHQPTAAGRNSLKTESAHHHHKNSGSGGRNSAGSTTTNVHYNSSTAKSSSTLTVASVASSKQLHSTPTWATFVPNNTNTSTSSTSNTKKSRNSNSNNQNNSNNNTNNNNNNNNSIIQQQSSTNENTAGAGFLSIGPQTAFFPTTNPAAGLTLASVQQQLQPGSVAVFTSPTMAMATLAGAAGPPGTVQHHHQPGASPGTQIHHQHSHQQQLVVTPTGQAMAQQFSGTFQANGQTHQLIQAPGMGMMGGLSQVQVIGTNGQQYFPQFYTTGQMQPMLLNNLTMAIPAQTAGQNLTIQLPNGQQATGATMITTAPMAQSGNPTTPVKGSNTQTTIVKGVTISPQHHHQQQQAQQSKNANTIVAGKSTTTATTQQAIIQQTATFQQNPQNQTIVIGLQQPTATQNGTTATLLSATPTNARKTTNSGRSNNSNKLGSNLIQKIQPASQSLLSPAQFKTTNTSFVGSPNVSQSNQTIMVHGQSIPTGGGSIQLTNQPTIISPLPSFQTIQPGLTWATSPQLNQQSLMAPNGQIVQIRTQNAGDSPQMYIQTSGNQFQALPMQMTPGTAQQAQSNQATTGMQMAQTGQTMMTSSINPSLPISIQTNHHQGMAMSSTTMVTQHTNAASNMLTVVSSASNAPTLTTTPTTMSSNTNRHRPLRPAASLASFVTATTQQSTISTQTSNTKPKITESNRTTAGVGMAKLAPKGSTNTTVTNSAQKLPLPPINNKTSQSDQSTATNTCISNQNLNMVQKTSTAKINTSTQSVSSSVAGTTNSASLNTTPTSSVLGLNGANNLVNATAGISVAPNAFSKITIPMINNNLNSNNKKTEKKDAASGTESSHGLNKGTIMIPPVIAATKPTKITPNVLRTSNKTSAGSAAASTQSSNTQSFPSTNGVGGQQQSTTIQGPMNSGSQQQQPSKNSTLKNGVGMTNSTGGGGVSTKSNTANQSGTNSSNTSILKPITNNKSKANDAQVLTHIIDGYVIQESANPFPINGFLTLNEIENTGGGNNNNTSTKGGEDSSSSSTTNANPNSKEVEQKENGGGNHQNMENKVNINNNNSITSAQYKDATIKPKENGVQNSSLLQHNNNDSNHVQPAKSLLQQPTQQQQLPLMSGQQPQQQKSLATTANNKMNIDLCTQCGLNKRMQNAKKKKWKKLCATCVDKLMKQQQQQPLPGFNVIGASNNNISTQVSASSSSSSSSAGIGGPNAAAANSNSTTSSTTKTTTSTITTTTTTGGIVNGLGGAGGVHLAEKNNQSNQSTATGNNATNSAVVGNQNGRINNMKRPLNQTTTINDQRTLPKKLRLTSATNKFPPQTNGDSSSTVSNGTDSSNNNNNNNETDQLWLPNGGNIEPSKWTVQEVFDFMSHLEGCGDLAEGFRTQEIDGQALMLIKEDHIIDILNTKLGPALKICRKIKELKDKFNY